ncbi:hypothetical protein Godav_021981 [Gossypium davidsonii]|uniref:Uncharacterized protein n=1 Tax=Gossypium davidsonii TaxID=34287 RepID=A0A7J8TJJ5_GOSDV|nr:hypothetical protein [Gossypium davidsonii]
MEVLPPKGQPFLKGERIHMNVVFKPWDSRALESTSREDNCQIASFDSNLPQIVYMDCRRNHEDELKGIWQSWDEAKKMRF